MHTINTLTQTHAYKIIIHTQIIIPHHTLTHNHKKYREGVRQRSKEKEDERKETQHAVGEAWPSTAARGGCQWLAGG